MATSFEPVVQFYALQDLEYTEEYFVVYFIIQSTIPNIGWDIVL